MNVLEALKGKQGLTDTEEAIADYILTHVDDVTHMNIGDLSKLAHCSSSAIVRLCHKIGLDGYRDLRVELARSIEYTRINQLEVNPDRPFIEDSGTADITSSIAALTKQAVDATHAGISTALVQRAARLILGARHVAYYAIGDSLASMEMFNTLLVKLSITCVSGLHMNDFGAMMQLLDARDVMIIVTHSGNMVDTFKKGFGVLRSRGVRTIVITADPTMGERMAGIDALFTLPQGESRSQRLATFYSQACIRYVLNCIYAEAYARNYQQNKERWEEIVHLEGE